MGWGESLQPYDLSARITIEYQTDSFAQTLADAEAPRGAEIRLFDTPEHFTGPFPTEGVQSRIAELELLEPASTSIIGSEATLMPGTDLLPMARALEAHPWVLNLDDTRVQTGTIDYGLLERLHGHGYGLSLASGRLELGRLTSQTCTDLLGELQTPLALKVTCSEGGSTATIGGSLKDVAHDWAVLAPVLGSFEDVEIEPVILLVRMDAAAEADLASALAPLRGLTWREKRGITLYSGTTQAAFKSDATGKAEPPLKLTAEEQVLADAWDASSG